MITITRKLEFDAGHRIPDHKSQCKNLHGHRYVLHLTLTGKVIDAEKRSDSGMLMDFSEVKEIAQKNLVDSWDHAFLVYEKDEVVRNFLESIPNHKTVVFDCVTTAENLARKIFETLAPIYAEKTDLRLIKVTLFETPNCWAEFSA